MTIHMAAAAPGMYWLLYQARQVVLEQRTYQLLHSMLPDRRSGTSSWPSAYPSCMCGGCWAYQSRMGRMPGA